MLNRTVQSNQMQGHPLGILYLITVVNGRAYPAIP